MLRCFFFFFSNTSHLFAFEPFSSQPSAQLLFFIPHYSFETFCLAIIRYRNLSSLKMAIYRRYVLSHTVEWVDNTISFFKSKPVKVTVPVRPQTLNGKSSPLLI